MPLNKEQLLFYADEGYLLFPALLSSEKRSKYRTLFDRMVTRAASMQESQDGFCLAPDEEGKPIPGRLHKVQGVCLADERVLELASEPEILDCVESLLGPDIDM